MIVWLVVLLPCFTLMYSCVFCRGISSTPESIDLTTSSHSETEVFVTINNTYGIDTKGNPSSFIRFTQGYTDYSS